MRRRRGLSRSFVFDEALEAILAARGARADRSGGPLSRAGVLRRLLERYDETMTRCDPVASGRFPEGYVRLFLDLVRAPWQLTPFDVEVLPELLGEARGLAELAARRGVRAEDFLARLRELSYPERLALVDRAEKTHAPKYVEEA